MKLILNGFVLGFVFSVGYEGSKVELGIVGDRIQGMIVILYPSARVPAYSGQQHLRNWEVGKKVGRFLDEANKKSFLFILN